MRLIEISAEVYWWAAHLRHSGNAGRAMHSSVQTTSWREYRKVQNNKMREKRNGRNRSSAGSLLFFSSLTLLYSMRVGMCRSKNFSSAVGYVSRWKTRQSSDNTETGTSTWTFGTEIIWWVLQLFLLFTFAFWWAAFANLMASHPIWWRRKLWKCQIRLKRQQFRRIIRLTTWRNMRQEQMFQFVWQNTTPGGAKHSAHSCHCPSEAEIKTCNLLT